MGWEAAVLQSLLRLPELRHPLPPLRLLLHPGKTPFIIAVDVPAALLQSMLPLWKREVDRLHAALCKRMVTNFELQSMLWITQSGVVEGFLG